ncbi:MAG: hypothetical protein MUE96_11710 [Bacteroidia bacterium]|nr:hypothetical protein [Bacteroidia bacterium]
MSQSVSLNAGFAIPTSTFSNESLRENNGFAYSGSAIRMEVNYPIKSNIGFTAMATHCRFGFDVSAYAAELNRQIVVPGSYFNVKALNDYQTTSMLVGPSLQLGKKRITAHVSLLVGFMHFQMAQLETQTNYVQTSNTVVSPNRTAITGTLGWGIACKAALTNHWYLQLSADQFFANPQLDGNYLSNNTTPTNLGVQAFITAIGLGYQFR